MTEIPLFDLLLSLTGPRFDEVVEALGARAYVTEKAPPVTRARELLHWTAELGDRTAQLRAVLSAEISRWPEDVLARWRAWATLRLGEIPILGFQGSMRAPVDLQSAFVPLALSVHHQPLDGRLEGERAVGWTLKRAVADAEGAGIRSMRGLVLVGLPGSGKTTLLKHAWGVVADRGAADLGFQDGSLLPVFVRVAWCDPSLKPQEMLPAALRRGLEEHGYAAAADLLLRHRLVWMLDGFDEAGSLEHRKALAETLSVAMDHRPQDRYLLTSRTAGWRDVEGMLAGRLRTWDVQALDKKDVPGFILRWHEAVLPVLMGAGRKKEEIAADAARSAEDLSDRLLSSDWLADHRREKMVRNPLLLSVLCLVNRKVGDLPERRADLYDHALKTMMEELRQIDAYGPTRQLRHRGLPTRETLRLLGVVAWEAHDSAKDGDVREFTTAEATAWIQPVLAKMPWPEPEAFDARDVLCRAEEHCGLLQATQADAWQFAHLTFQEYLAARHAASEGLAQALAARAGQDRWEEPIRLAMSTDRLPAELMTAILARRQTPWDRPRFQALMADCAREADPTPFANALRRCAAALSAAPCWPWLDGWLARLRGRMSRPEAAALAVAVLSLFQGRPPPLALVGPSRVIADLPKDEPARRAARALLGLPLADQDASERSGEPCPGDVRTLALPGGPPLALVWVPGGDFWMGASKEPGSQNYDPGAFEDEGPVRRVRLSAGYWLGMHPVTNAQYRAFVRGGPHREAATAGIDSYDGDDQPVTSVDWTDATAFCAWLSRVSASRVTLPTEAQWERAARGDDSRTYPWGDEAPTRQRAVFGGAPLAAVGGRPAGAGPYGTQDQAGNVWEWCQDVWEDHYPAVSGVDVDPCRLSTPDSAAPRVVRGGSWDDDSRSLRAAYRFRGRPGYRLDFLGFRVCVLREPGP